MRKTALHSFVLTGLFALVVSAAAGSVGDPAPLAQAIANARLNPDGAVEIESLTLKLGMAVFDVDRGIFFPATPVGERVVEMVFMGQARLLLDPPDSIEAGQLELFTGSPGLEEEISEAVLAIAVDTAVDAIYSRPPYADLDPASRSQAEEIFRRWKARPERRLLGVETAILGDGLGDPFYETYFAGWFRGQELGEFLYLFEPNAAEQIILGQFVTLDATAKEKRKLARQLDRAQRKGRLIGLTVEDLGQWDTWLSASLSDQEGKPTPGARAFEPQHYLLDLTISDAKLELHGRAQLHLRAVTSVGRVVTLDIHPDLAVRSARAEDGTELFFHQSRGDVLVVLPQAPAREETLAIEIEYSGHLIDKDSKTWTLRSPTHWYPHAGTFDLATYDVTFHWPEKLDLITGGQRVDGGVEDGGRRFERRRLDHPTFGFSFEIGNFRTLTRTAGHVTVTLALDPLAQSLVDKKGRDELLTAITDAVTYFEEIFGPYPLDELMVATALREYSQSFLGFITLSSLSTGETNLLTVLLGLEDRRTVVAHEIAHQWWGHMVAWQSYRDQWISEAMANYAAVLYARNRLKGEGESILIGPTTGWQTALTSTLADGRPLESLGPLVLGERLDSSHSEDAYQAIVYKKGAVVLDMLSRFFREEDFLKMLRRLVEFVAFRPISTPVFVEVIERLSGQNLDGFAQQFIYGTGLPDIYYTYEFKPEEGDKWSVVGVARQESPYRYQYRVVARSDGALDVIRERLDQIEVDDSVLAVPVEIAVFDPNGETRKQKDLDPRLAGNAMVTTHMLLRGESSDFRLQLDYEPKELWLDRKREVFGRFFNEHRHPKRMLYYQGLDLSAAGRLDEAEAFYRKALAAEAFAGPAYGFSPSEDVIKGDSRALDAYIQLELTRLYLDQDRPSDARDAFAALRKLLTNSIRYTIAGQVKTLEARLAIRDGDHERAYKLLRKEIRRQGGLGSTESLLFLAIAAREAGHDEEFEAAVESATELGADVTLLSP